MALLILHLISASSTCSLISRVLPCLTCRCLCSQPDCWCDTTQLWFFFFLFPFFAVSYQWIYHQHCGSWASARLRMGDAMQIVTSDRPPGIPPPPPMIMPCVVCLFRLKVISFVTFSALLCLCSIKLITVRGFGIGKGKEGRKRGEEKQSKQGLMAFSGRGTTQIYYNTKLMCTPSAWLEWVSQEVDGKTDKRIDNCEPFGFLFRVI